MKRIELLKVGIELVVVEIAAGFVVMVIVMLIWSELRHTHSVLIHGGAAGQAVAAVVAVEGLICIRCVRLIRFVEQIRVGLDLSQ